MIVGALWAGLTVSLSAATTIFDNSVNDLSVRFNPGTIEVGDQIMLANTERYLTYFDFEYLGDQHDTPGEFLRGSGGPGAVLRKQWSAVPHLSHPQ